MCININSSSLRYGVFFGYKLSRLEWIWGSRFDFAQEMFESSKLEVLVQLSTCNTHFDETNYQTFSQSILSHFLRTDIETYSSILIGIAIQRAALIGASSDPNKNSEMISLAKSPLISIPKKIVPDKEKLFNCILRYKDMELFDILNLLDRGYGGNIDNLNISDTQEAKASTTTKPKLFLSYSQKDECIANIIENQLRFLTNNGIDISRYTRVPYKGSFRQFMNSIPDHDFVLSIVSDSYLKSQACMYEVGETVKDHNFEQKLLFIVLSEEDRKYYSEDDNYPVAAQIYGSETERLTYTVYWKNKYEALKEKIREIGDFEATSKASDELREIGQIYRKDISIFLDYLVKSRGRCFDELYMDRFADILQWIFPGWESRLFTKCRTFPELLTTALMKIWESTLTDYNQIALTVKISSHQSGLVVFADNISETKQRYRLVVMEGLMGNAFATGNVINVADTNQDSKYFQAVGRTKSELVIPIKFQGNVIGVINSESEEASHYTRAMVKRLLIISDALSIALNRLGYIANMAADQIPYIHIEF